MSQGGLSTVFKIYNLLRIGSLMASKVRDKCPKNVTFKFSRHAIIITEKRFSTVEIIVK